MTYRGHVQNGVIVLDKPTSLPEGAVVDVRVTGGDAEPAREPPTTKSCSIEEKLAAIWADVPASEWANLPADLTDHLDHYIYGTPKR